MKKNIYVRLLTVLCAAFVLATAACAVAEGFFGVPMSAWAGKLLAASDPLAVFLKLLVVVLLAVLAVGALLCTTPPRGRKPSDFVMQRSENGTIGIAVRAIEKQVMSCVAKHDVIAASEVAVRECRDGLIILLNVDQVAGVSIPLSVGLLQRQIKQYVTSCTGLDVHEVRVMVENNTTNVVASPYIVQDNVIGALIGAEEAGTPDVLPPVTELLPEAAEEEAVEETVPAPEAEPAAVQAPAAPVVLPELPPLPVQPAEPDDDERPLHQRLFGSEEEPVFVPAPPEMIPEAEEESAETAEEEVPAAQETPADEADPIAEEHGDDGEADAAYCGALWAEEVAQAEDVLEQEAEALTAEDPAADNRDEEDEEERSADAASPMIE